MTATNPSLYQQRLRRYVTALNNGKPDMVPIRPFVAEFTARYAGYTCQEVTQDYGKAFDAACKCAADFGWDAVVANMVYVWSGITEPANLRYYAIPGVDIEPNTGFQYIEPGEENAFMREDEYDRLIDDPTAFLYEVWYPRVSRDIVAPGQPATLRHNASLVKTAMAMSQYFHAFGPQVARLQNECGTASAIAGIFKAPFDILADKLRGYVGLTMDMVTQPKKVLKACEALMPHLYWVAANSADGAHQVPIGYWMHRGCLPFVSKGQFESHYWPTVKPIVEELWRDGHQTMFYAEGKWDAHLDSFRELPDRSILYHVDQGDIFLAHRKLHDKFALSGGISNVLMSIGKPEEVRARVKEVIEGVAKDGGYILDAGAIMQNDVKIENMKAFTEAGREYGVYSSAPSYSDPLVVAPSPGTKFGADYGLKVSQPTRRAPGELIPWNERLKELPSPLPGDAALAERSWKAIDASGVMFIWQMLLSF